MLRQIGKDWIRNHIPLTHNKITLAEVVLVIAKNYTLQWSFILKALLFSVMSATYNGLFDLSISFIFS